MKRVASIQELIDTKEKEFEKEVNGKRYRISRVAIYRMTFKEVIQLVNLEGLYYISNQKSKGRWGEGAPGSDSYFSMAD